MSLTIFLKWKVLLSDGSASYWPFRKIAKELRLILRAENGEGEMEINHLRYEPLAEYSIVFGKEINDAELIELISGIGCQKAIAILSRFASLHIAVCHQNHEAICLDWKLRMLHSGHIKELGGNWLQYNQFKTIMCPQSIFILEKWALVHCPKEKDFSPITIPDLMLIMDALIAINDKLPKGDVDGHETEYLYLMLYHNTHKSTKHQIARSFYVFSILAKQDDETTDFLNLYEQKKGFSIEDRLAVLFNSLGNVIPRFTVEDMFTKGLCVQIEGFDAKGLAPVYEKIIKGIRNSYKETQKNIHGILSQVWNFEPFYHFPFIQIGNSQFAFSETTIVYQMWEGLYWDVRYAFRNDGEAFMTQFGRPFEHYIQRITNAAAIESKNKVAFQNEFSYKFKGNTKASTDCYFRIGNTLIAVEAKAKSPHSSTLTGLAREAIENEVTELMIDPVRQALTRLKEINSEENDITGNTRTFFNGVEQTIILSVSMEKVQPIGELLFMFDAAIKPELSGCNVVAYQNVCVEEYEVICNLIETYPDELPEILTAWFMAQREDIRSAVVLANFLPSCGKQYVCSKYVSTLFEDSLREISLRTFGKDLSSKLDL